MLCGDKVLVGCAPKPTTQFLAMIVNLPTVVLNSSVLIQIRELRSTCEFISLAFRCSDVYRVKVLDLSQNAKIEISLKRIFFHEKIEGIY